MDIISQLITNVRESYVKQKLTDDVVKNKQQAIKDLQANLSSPITEQYRVNGEEEVFKNDMQNMIEHIAVDLISVDKSFAEIAAETDTLLANTIASINNAKAIAKRSQNVLDNVNKICGYYTSFDTIITMDNGSFTGDYGLIDDNTFCCGISSQEDVPLTIVDVKGTGAELTQESNLIDSDELSYYDYLGSEVGKDVSFVATVKADAAFTLLKVYSTDILAVTSLSVSDNGIVYDDILRSKIKVAGKDVLLNGNYYGLGLVGFPETYYAKIGLTANEYIHINKLAASYSEYRSETKLVGNEITSKEITSIAVYASEYTPEGFENGDYFKYVLTVNGVDYKIEPINSQRTGTKIIKYKTDGIVEDGVIGIANKITSAKLTIVLKTPDSTQTPFVSNIKICLGAEI